ncbi:phytoene/squalene synthase family protein [Urechidicola vernalis]|uniref:Phytoene/squalene synthase family protein n=1 Tax=Urechidicola vernalis TaxID=3075600 RepID=A0ABU2Y2H0_9FLAO|nr:phytoene/squalene synthase family protein [Urechidicola sp. P050]MDT0552396.1 phytoene/squalene synthase family protein [Urechidicola sp. P050]
MKKLFDNSSFKCSKLITNTYSTSFSLGIKLFHPNVQNSIYKIYAFVRYADEIVDSFHKYDREELFIEFEKDYEKSLRRRISLNPILNAFQEVVLKFELQDLVQDFMRSMKADLYESDYTSTLSYEEYIHGSANVVGLMCLKVFVEGDIEEYNRLKSYAMKLGSAFQKVNFLRDLKDDYEILGRSYFPELSLGNLDADSKLKIIEDIEEDFHEAYKGIVLLPKKCKLGVYVAFTYYRILLRKLKKKNVNYILNERTRISNPVKVSLLCTSYIRYKLNVL